MKVSLPYRPRFRPRQIAIAVCMIAGYLALMGEAIHCQYFLPDHEAHHHSSTRPVNHATHCLMASHCAAAAIHSVGIVHHNTLELLGLLFGPNPVLPGTGIVIAKTARAPPAA